MHTVQFFVKVALPVPIDTLFTYAACQTCPQPGQVVRVPFGRRTVWGVVWGMADAHPNAKVIDTVHPVVSFSTELRHFLDKMAAYLMCPLGMVLKMALPHMAYEDSVFFQKNTSTALPKRQGKALDRLRNAESDTLRLLVSQWIEHTGVRSNQWATWCQEGYIVSSADQSLVPHTMPSMHHSIDLSPAQHAAAQDIATAWDSKPVLLEGLTGSGKTEVVLSLCPDVWAKGRQVLVLLPEIALINQWVKRIEQYFDPCIAVWHSGLSKNDRQRHFDRIVSGSAHIIVGARSALALPYPRLGAIIVDEEHETSYKQAETVLYHGRDMAVWRSRIERIPVVLSSATPSMESRWNVVHDKYAHVQLRQRFGAAQLPAFQCIDMRHHPPRANQWISPVLRQRMQETLDKKQQVLLFLNRRGYAQRLVCFSCQFRALCPRCDVCLSVHNTPPHLLCHYCGHQEEKPKACPQCGQSHALFVRGPGVEQIHDEVIQCFPSARTVVLSSDHMTTPKVMETALSDMASGAIDIMIGTQMAAKGHHFPLLTCIGIIDSDFMIQDIDFRSGERLFQLLYQVAGRAGRAEWPGHVYLQTMDPQHGLFQALAQYDWTGFVHDELRQRKDSGLPPETRMTCVTVSGACQWAVKESALRMGATVPHAPGITVLGPSPALVNPLRNRYRWHTLVIAPRHVPVQHFLTQWMGVLSLCKGTRVTIDRDPHDFL